MTKSGRVAAGLKLLQTGCSTKDLPVIARFVMCMEDADSETTNLLQYIKTEGQTQTHHMSTFTLYHSIIVKMYAMGDRET